MTREIDGALSPIRKFLENRTLIIDLVAKFTITFGVILIVGGLYLMVANPDLSVAAQASQGSQSVVFSVGSVPGVPFLMSDLSGLGGVMVGSVSWIIGVNLLLVGLGLWVRHKIARLAAMLIFGLAAFFQLIQLLLVGIFGAPLSILLLFVDAAFAYFLFSKFDAKPVSPSSVT